MTAEELTDAGWKFTTRTRKSDGCVRVRAVHKEHGLDMSVVVCHGATEERAVSLMIRKYVEPTHDLLIAKRKAA